MDKEIIKSDDTEIEKYKFQQYKSPISINLMILKLKNTNFINIKALFP